MRRTSLFNALAGLLLSTVLLSCAGTQPRQYAVLPDEESGIGGTGIIAREDGIGGTGIVGEITGFGSIFVNGVEVELDQQTRILVDGKPVNSHDFSRGEVVAVHSVKRDGLPYALEIHVQHEVIGVVEKTLSATQIMVMGQIVDTTNTGQKFKPGTVVKVSGFRDPQSVIHARLIQPHQGRERLLRGLLQKKDGRWVIGQQSLQSEHGLPALQQQPVQVNGRIEHGVLKVEQIKPDTLPFSAEVQHLILQGYTQQKDKAHYRMAAYMLDMKVGMVKHMNMADMHGMVRVELKQHEKQWKMIRILDQRTLPKGSRRSPAGRPYMRHHSTMPGMSMPRPMMRGGGFH